MMPQHVLRHCQVAPSSWGLLGNKADATGSGTASPNSLLLLGRQPTTPGIASASLLNELLLIPPQWIDCMKREMQPTAQQVKQSLLTLQLMLIIP